MGTAIFDNYSLVLDGGVEFAILTDHFISDQFIDSINQTRTAYPSRLSFADGLIKGLENKEILAEGAVKRREELSIDKAMKEYAEVFHEVYQRKYKNSN